MRKPEERTIKVSDILAFIDKVREVTGEQNPEVTFECVNNSLFPLYWREMQDRMFVYHTSHSDDDSDCYCE